VRDKPAKQKQCLECGVDFLPRLTTQRVCSPPCALSLSRRKNADKARKAQRTKDRQWKLENKTRSEWLSTVQVGFNRFIRLRDRGLPCISCGTPEHVVERGQAWKFGGAWDCGHYLTVGAFPELRFTESNAHRQCKSCNSGSHHHVRKGRTVREGYRDELVRRIGLDGVEWLEGPHPPARWTIDELKAMHAEYLAKCRSLKEGREK